MKTDIIEISIMAGIVIAILALVGVLVIDVIKACF